MTHAQKLASNPGHSVYVAASAGSGKTKVLTDRVLRILLAGTPPGKIMCLTFTNAAAAEMANRINKSLMKWTIASDEELQKDIQNLTSSNPDKKTMHLARRLFVEVLDTPDGLKIQTIHAFCQNLMRKFPLEAGIAPHFQVIDEQTSLELLKEARMRLLSNQEQLAEPVRKAINSIAWRVHESSFTSLLQEITENREKIEHLLGSFTMEEIIGKIYKTLDVPQGVCEEDILQGEKFNIETLQEAIELLSQSSPNDIKCSKALAAMVESNRNIAEKFEKYKYAFLTSKEEPKVDVATKSFCKKNEFIGEFLKREQQRVLSVNDKVKSVRIANLTEDLFHISEAVLELYKKSKTTKAYLDYNDLIIASNRLLHKPDIAPWILYKLDGGIDHLLVDEAQDTSPEQWSIIEALCEEFFTGEGAHENNRTIFIVGDEKQSIFSFQGADPKTFHQMQEVFSTRAKNAQKGWEAVSLDMSFRSTDPVLRVVDGIFANDTIKQAITFKPGNITHTAFRNKHAGKVEFWPLVEKDDDTKPEPWTLPLKRIEPNNPKKKLANKIADEVKNWLDSGRKIEARGRKVQPGDIMILVRRRNILVDYIVSALKKNNIPVAGIDRMIITDHIAIMDLIALGNFLLLPQDDLNLAAVLKSPLIGISEDQLFELSYKRGKKSLWESLKSSKLKEIYEYLSELLNKTDFLSPFELYSYILEVKNGRKQLAERLGLETTDPIDEFLSLALSYEKSHPPSLQGFLHWLSVGQTEIKRDLDQGNNEIRIMTVHGSKGLQAPIVFLPDTTGVPTAKSSNILWSDDINPIMLWTGRSDNLNQSCRDLKEKRKKIEQDEYLRLLYVALTRAEDELYICGNKESKKLSESCWYNIVQQGIEPIATKNGDILTVKSEQKDVANNDNQSEGGIIPIKNLPDFINTPTPDEPTPSIPLTPSQMTEENPAAISPLAGKAILRGKLIHKLLQYLPDIEQEKHELAANNLLQKHDSELSNEEQNEIFANTIKIINDKKIAHIFGKGSKAEVPIAGVIGKYVLSGRIDRLLVTEDEILIVDYKTNRNPPKDVKNVHKNYIHQMSAYRSALEEIYPNRKITCALVWTQTAKIMVL